MSKQEIQETDENCAMDDSELAEVVGGVTRFIRPINPRPVFALEPIETVLGSFERPVISSLPGIGILAGKDDPGPTVEPGKTGPGIGIVGGIKF